MSPKAARLAEKLGYSNVKVFKAGMPAWKKAKLPVQIKSEWVTKNLDPGTIILDIRKNARNHVKTSVGLSSSEIKSMGQKYANKKRGKKKGELYSKRNLPGILDKGAPIILYGDSYDDPDVQSAFKELVSWKYKSVAMLDLGFSQWKTKGLPTSSGSASPKFHYIKKLVKGAIPADEFQGFVKNRGFVLDVRTAKESKKGMIPSALNIPLDMLESNLSKLPKNKAVAIHCVSGVRAGIAYNLLKTKGFKDVRFLNEPIKIKKNGSYKIN